MLISELICFIQCLTLLFLVTGRHPPGI